MRVVLDVNPAVRGISKVMELLHEKFPAAEMEPFSQVSLRVTIDSDDMLRFCETLDMLALFYTEVKP